MEVILGLLILLQLSSLSSSLISSSVQPLCNEHDQAALLHFKLSFSLDQTNCLNPNPHLLSWVLHNETNNTAGCCSWEGVTCEVSSGRVTGLDLSYGCLFGPIDSTNSIFRLTQLQQINLAGNDFSQSQIPSAFGKFSMLKNLNLSQASFSGFITQEILELSSLTSLDLSSNPFLYLPRHGLASIARNMKDLTELGLSQINIYSAIPATFANLTSLRILQLENCNLQDNFPVEIFLLPRLEHLNVMSNYELYGHLPEFPIGRTSLRSLQLSFTQFGGELPGSIGNLISLQHLDFKRCNFSGSIPYTLGKLVNITVLRLSFNQFSGSIPSSLENLTSLTNLSLAYNPFTPTRFSCISWIGKLTELKGLYLPNTNLFGSIPFSLSKLKQIEDLYLFSNHLSGRIPSWIGILTKLKWLDLNSNHLSSQIPSRIGNLTKLKWLDISSNNLNGSIPFSLSKLEQIEVLYLNFNHLSGRIPSWIGNLTKLKFIDLSNNNLNGSIPFSLSKLEQIEVLCLYSNLLNGQIPSWIGNLTKLKWLDLNSNHLSGQIPSWIGNLTKLKWLDISINNLNGSIPFSLSKLEQIEDLYLNSNQLSGRIPSWIGNLTQLVHLWLGHNNLEGQIPRSIFSLKNLEYLSLVSNHLSGTVDISMFHEQKNIQDLTLSHNHLSVVSNKFMNSSLPNLEVLLLGSCNLREFPLFLKNLDNLKVMSLAANNIFGEIPAWFLNISTDSMLYLNLSYNNLTGFEQPVHVLPWQKLEVLSLNFNNIHGSLPLPPPSISLYELSNNFIGGELSPTFCNANTLSVLDLSSNELVGTIPECLGNLGSSLQVLNLKGNKFEGKIPQIHTDKCSLRWFDLSQNQLKGKLPRTLAKCRDLERFDVGNNHITDTFPSWLGALPKLQVLILKINNFHGPMGSPSFMGDFPELRIIDLSNNALTGALPSKYFPLWKGMSVRTKTQLPYFMVTLNWNLSVIGFVPISVNNYSMSTEIMNKGMDREYDKLLSMMVFISLSNNKFVGEIPESIGDLVGLVGLDLSNNNLTGSIPPTFGNLKELESLDLSFNMLSGEIPQQFSQLTFLGYLNMSYNNLSGPIPRGGQLGTFGNNSFNENPWLCGFPLLNIRGGVNEPSTSDEDQEHESSDHTKLVLGFEGLATGLAIGLGIGYIIATRNHQWFVKTCLKLRHRK